MPVLDISESGKLKRTFDAELLAVMCFLGKKEEKERAGIRASIAGKWAADFLTALRDIHEDSRAPFERGAIPILVAATEAPRFEELDQVIRRRLRNAWVSRVVLSSMLATARHHPEIKFNITSMVDALGKFYAMKSQTARHSIASGETIRAWWQKFKTVAHIDLAHIWFDGLLICGRKMDFYRDIRWFLALVESTRWVVVEHGFLKEEQTWRVPEDLVIDLPGFDIRNTIDPLEPELLSFLKT